MKTTQVAVLAGIFLSALILAACGSKDSSLPTASQAPTSVQASVKKEPVLYTAKACLSQMTGLAVRWQRDAAPFHMESGLNSESLGHDGKSTVWRAMFASPSHGTYRTFTCSGSRLREEPAMGVTTGSESPYGREVPQLIFHPINLTTDSDQAFALTQDKGGSKLLEKNPKQPVVYSLDYDAKQKQLVWVVMYGTSRQDAKGIAVIDAGTGKYLRAAK